MTDKNTPDLGKSLEKLDLEGVLVLQAILARRALDILKDNPLPTVSKESPAQTALRETKELIFPKPPVILIQ